MLCRNSLIVVKIMFTDDIFDFRNYLFSLQAFSFVAVGRRRVSLFQGYHMAVGIILFLPHTPILYNKMIDFYCDALKHEWKMTWSNATHGYFLSIEHINVSFATVDFVVSQRRTIVWLFIQFGISSHPEAGSKWTFFRENFNLKKSLS